MAALKNLLNKEALRKISVQLEKAWPGFDPHHFQKILLPKLAKLELKERVKLIAQQMQDQRPCQAKDLYDLTEALFDETKNPQGLTGFQVWPLTEYVAQFGIHEFKASMHFLESATKVFTAEFAVRAFFIKDPHQMLRQFLTWSKHPNEHLRRLASEGSRPLLPWGEKLERIALDPTLTSGILLQLANDPSKYVQKSVANHWNDHSKNHPTWTLQQLKNWPQAWTQKHALRTLLKKGHPAALKILGFNSTQFKLDHFSVSPTRLTWDMKIKLKGRLQNLSRKNQRVMIDIVLKMPSAKKGILREKVFKGSQYLLENQREIQLMLPFRKVSTRKYYSGKYFVHLRINGVDFPSKSFTFHDKL